MSDGDQPGADAMDLARRVGHAMFERDHASRALEIKVEEIAPGYARLSMTVRRDMLNGLDTCHGGFLFTLADSAFAFACNSRNELSVAAGCSIEYLRLVREGEVLSAVAQERALIGRSGVYDVAVTDSSGQTVALFRGKSARVKGALLPAT